MSKDPKPYAKVNTLRHTDVAIGGMHRESLNKSLLIVAPQGISNLWGVVVIRVED